MQANIHPSRCYVSHLAPVLEQMFTADIPLATLQPAVAAAQMAFTGARPDLGAAAAAGCPPYAPIAGQ
jgi:hypothetical protein